MRRFYKYMHTWSSRTPGHNYLLLLNYTTSMTSMERRNDEVNRLLQHEIVHFNDDTDKQRKNKELYVRWKNLWALLVANGYYNQILSISGVFNPTLSGRRVLHGYTKIGLTPINMDPGDISPYTALARHNYLHQLALFMTGGFAWDSDDHNTIREGQLFGFVQYQPVSNQMDRIDLFEVRHVYPPEFRFDHWLIPEHSNRDLIELSGYIGSVSFSTYKRMMGDGANKKTGHFVTQRGTSVRKWPAGIEISVP